MGMACSFIRLSDKSVDTLLNHPKFIHSFLDGNVSSTHESREEGDEFDIDKDWHGLHFILTGEPEATNNLLGFLMSGGNFIGNEDVGYGPARIYTSNQVFKIIEAFTNINREALYQRYNPKEMDRLKVYPNSVPRPLRQDSLPLAQGPARALD